MVNKIVMDKIASYKKQTVLETNKKVNIIYGLNGSGKTTISDFLYDTENSKFSSCSVDLPNDELLLVYNTSFIQDNFYRRTDQNGIFTLSKENKIAEENIKMAKEQIDILQAKMKQKNEHNALLLSKKDAMQRQATDKTWEIKTKYTGGDRVLEYCLDKMKSNKDVLFNHISKIILPVVLPAKTIDELKKEAALLNDETGKKYDLLPKIVFDFSKIERNEIFDETIIGNENSAVAGLIRQLKNADWVKSGIKYLPKENHFADEVGICPFCQQSTITKELFDSINNYFDDEYERKLTTIKNFLFEYANSFSAIKREAYDENPFINEIKPMFENLFNSLINCLDKNIRTIEDKVTSPSQKCSLSNTRFLISDFNSLVDEVNDKINAHNLKLDNKETALHDIKTIFWQIMRYEYDIVISDCLAIKDEIQLEIEAINAELCDIGHKIEGFLETIKQEQRKTVNIDEAIGNINRNLFELGMDGFKISKHQDNLYKITRDNMEDNTFLTLSEGEKMIISFLYFIELCKGKMNITETTTKKIIVIDDPISSLSHIYIFSVAEFIKRTFCNSAQFEQIFILTHSLYFFYEMASPNREKRQEKQNLFRIIKNAQGTSIFTMKYEEIQNDYQSYWAMINNPDYPPAIQANCMRNIIEHFFGFIEKKDLNNVFQKPNLQHNKFQGFNRFINRESHSSRQNIFDYKEFDYFIFKEAMELLFCESGYKDHYDKMSKIGC